MQPLTAISKDLLRKLDWQGLEHIYITGAFLAFGMNCHRFRIETWWPDTTEQVVPLLNALAWSLLSWPRVGWLLANYLGPSA